MKECLDGVSFGVGETVLCPGRGLRGEQERGATDELGGSVNALHIWILRLVNSTRFVAFCFGSNSSNRILVPGFPRIRPRHSVRLLPMVASHRFFARANLATVRT